MMTADALSSTRKGDKFMKRLTNVMVGVAKANAMLDGCLLLNKTKNHLTANFHYDLKDW
jgi:hypothetical protein